MSDRDVKFGRLIAIANVLGNRVADRDEIGISAQHLSNLGKKPAQTLERLHRDLMEHAGKFGRDELALLDLFGEIMADLDLDEFTNDPLDPVYLHAYHSEQNSLVNVMSVEDAAREWGLTPGTIKNYCAKGKIKAKKIGRDWAIEKNQKNPRKYSPSDHDT